MRSSFRPRPASRIFASLITGVAALGLASPAAAQYLAETREVVWSAPDEPDLLAKANGLATPVALYEFARNEFAFAAYDGARSNATNTFLHRRGNDVDIASVLIAMLRSQGTPARYAEGLANFDETAVTSWLEIPHTLRAPSYLLETGYRNVGIGGGRIQFRHTWVQALVPLESYRGAGPATQIDCAADPGRCVWVDLDPSFKLHRFRDPAELVDISEAVLFDYDAFYHANDPAFPPPGDGIDRSDKGPLEVYEEQILHYLRTTSGLEGKTLEDCVYEGEVLPEAHGLLPTSLPFRVDPATVETYASVVDHDAAPGIFPWTKTVSFTVTFPKYAPLVSLTLSGGAPVPLVELSTQNLTFAYESTDFDDPATPKQLVARLGGQVHEVLLTLTSSSYTSNGGSGTLSGTPPDVGTPFDVHLSMQAAGTLVLDATYPDLTLGGSYLVATGGEHSSWSQVHRSARRLLQAVEENPVLPNEAENGALYVDANGNGSIDGGEVPLLEDAATQNLLTGGVLAIAKDLYFARVRDGIERVADLQRSTMPPVGFLGLVSSVHDVRSVDGTAFLLIPSGLLVDMKAIHVAPPYKIDADVPNGRVFRLGGHVLSSLEHEIWQELTGFEAISTMKGIQKTLTDGGTLMLLDQAELQVPIGSALSTWGFQPTVPAGIATRTLNLFGRSLWLPRTANPGAEMTLSVLRESVDSGTSKLRRRAWELEIGDAGSAFEPLFHFFENLADELAGLPDSDTFAFPYNVGDAVGVSEPVCGTATTVGQLESNLESCFLALMDRTELETYRDYLDYFDLSNGFVVGQHLYRAFEPATHIAATSIAPIRDEIVLGADTDGDGVPDLPEDTDGDTIPDLFPPDVEYLVPSIVADGELLDFAVWLRRYLRAGEEFATGYIINRAPRLGGVGPAPDFTYPGEIATRTVFDQGVNVVAFGGANPNALIDGTVATANALGDNDLHVVEFAFPANAVGPITAQTVRIWFNHASSGRTGDLVTGDSAVVLRTFQSSDTTGWYEFPAPSGYVQAGSWGLRTAGGSNVIAFGELERINGTAGTRRGSAD